jgi:hypothetical protein
MRELLGYPLDRERRLDAVLVGGGLHLLAVWIPLVPFVAVAGYLARVLSRTAEAGRLRGVGAPPWRPVGPLLADGVRVVGVAVVYLAVPTVLLVVTLGGPLERLNPTGTADGLLFLAGSTAVLVFALGLGYPLPAALAAVAAEGRFRAGFDRRLVGTACRDGRYLSAAVTAAGGVALAAAVYDPLNTVAVGFFLAFYMEVVCATLVGRAVGTAWTKRNVG